MSRSCTTARPSERRSPPAPPRRRALDAALAELESGAEQPSMEWRRQYSLLLGLERLLFEDEPHLADGTLLSAHQVDALSGTLTALAPTSCATATGTATAPGPTPPNWRPWAARARTTTRRTSPRSRRTGARARPTSTPTSRPARGPERRQALLVRARDRRRQDGRRAGLRRGVAHRRRPDPHPPPQPRRPVQRRAARPRLREPHHAGAAGRRGPGNAANGPVTVETYQWFVRNAGKISDAYTIVICDEAHTALGEKTSAAIRDWTGPDLHRHDRDGRADRPPRHRPLPDPDLALRSRPGRAPRRDRAAALRAHPARPGRAHDRQGAAAPRRGRHRVRPGDAGRAARPACRSTSRSPTSTRRASTACPASSTPPACATPTTSPRRSATSA